MKHPTYEIEKIGEIFDCEVQNRGMPSDDKSYAIFYCWMNGIKNYIGLNEGDLVKWNRYGKLKLSGKIAQIDRSYYDGTCPVLYVKLNASSLKKWLEYKAEALKKVA